MSLLVATLVTGLIFLIRPADRRSGAALVAGVAIAMAIAWQGMLKLYDMKGRPSLPHANDSNAWEQMLEACEGLMGNAWLCIILFFLAAGGLYVLYKQQRRFATLLIVSILIGIANLFIASMYRHIEGQRYLLGFLPAAWVGLGVMNAAMLIHRDKRLARLFLALFIAGAGYQLFRTITSEPPPFAAPMRDAAKTLGALGYTPDQALVFAPPDPMQMGGRFYGLVQSDLHKNRIMPAMQRGDATPKFIGRDRPAVLWMIVVTPCKPSQRKTEQDGLAAAKTAAGFYAQEFDADRLPKNNDMREMSILRLTPTSLDIWSPTGDRR
jgi:hypothetical protein